MNKVIIAFGFKQRANKGDVSDQSAVDDGQAGNGVVPVSCPSRLSCSSVHLAVVAAAAIPSHGKNRKRDDPEMR